MKDITTKKLMRGAEQLQTFAYNYPARNRIMGGNAHNDTVKWIKEELESTSYYDVTLQPFSNYVMLNGTINTFTIAGQAINTTLFEYSESTARTRQQPGLYCSRLPCNCCRQNRAHFSRHLRLRTEICACWWCRCCWCHYLQQRGDSC
jgi:hypothetical protein